MKTISIKNLSYSIPYSESILEGVTFEVDPGEFIGILGHNGSGKTTLMDLLLGFRPVTSGSISVLGEDPHQVYRKHKQQVVYLSQDVVLKGNLSIREYLRFHAAFYQTYSAADEARLLSVFSLDPDSRIGSLSTGQQKKVQVVAGLSVRPKLILIDEITAVLDPETRSIFFHEVEQVRKLHGTSILLATNIAEDLVDRADRILFVRKKQASVHASEEILKLFNISEAA